MRIRVLVFFNLKGFSFLFELNCNLNIYRTLRFLTCVVIFIFYKHTSVWAPFWSKFTLEVNQWN